MIFELIKFGLEKTLKIICEKIIIKNIQIVNKNNNFNGIIDEVYIKAESIIFNKVNISNINIKIRNLVLSFAFKNKKFFIDNCNAVINVRLTKDNINKTLFNNQWKRLRNSIESFIAMSFQSVEICDKSIYFIASDTFFNKNNNYSLQYDKNSISLLNNINQRYIIYRALSKQLMQV